MSKKLKPDIGLDDIVSSMQKANIGFSDSNVSVNINVIHASTSINILLNSPYSSSELTFNTSWSLSAIDKFLNHKIDVLSDEFGGEIIEISSSAISIISETIKIKINTNEATIRKIILSTYNQLLEYWRDNFYDQCQKGFVFVDEDDIDETIKILLRQFKLKYNWEPDIEKCQFLKNHIVAQGSTIKKSKRQIPDDDDDDDDDAN